MIASFTQPVNCANVMAAELGTAHRILYKIPTLFSNNGENGLYFIGLLGFLLKKKVFYLFLK